MGTVTKADCCGELDIDILSVVQDLMTWSTNDEMSYGTPSLAQRGRAGEGRTSCHPIHQVLTDDARAPDTRRHSHWPQSSPQRQSSSHPRQSVRGRQCTYRDSGPLDGTRLPGRTHPTRYRILCGTHWVPASFVSIPPRTEPAAQPAFRC